MIVPEDDIVDMAECIETAGNNLEGMKQWRWKTEPYPSLRYAVFVLQCVKELGMGAVHDPQ